MFDFLQTLIHNTVAFFVASIISVTGFLIATPKTAPSLQHPLVVEEAAQQDKSIVRDKPQEIDMLAQRDTNKNQGAEQSVEELKKGIWQSLELERLKTDMQSFQQKVVPKEQPATPSLEERIVAIEKRLNPSEAKDTQIPIIDPHLRRFVASIDDNDFTKKQGGWHGNIGIQSVVEDQQPSSGIALIEWYIDGSSYARTTYKPGNAFSFWLTDYTDGTQHADANRDKIPFDTTKYHNGIHTIMVKATDNAGNIGQSKEYEFVIKN